MSTSAQRDLIRSLMRELEFDMKYLSLLHSRIPHCKPNGMVDAWIDALTRAQASQVINWLKEEVQ